MLHLRQRQLLIAAAQPKSKPDVAKGMGLQMTLLLRFVVRTWRSIRHIGFKADLECADHEGRVRAVCAAA
jgi:hypothetical protein